MPQQASDALIVSDGGLASLVAVWREVVRAGHDRATTPRVRVKEELAAVVSGRKASGPAVWPTPGIGERQALAARRQAELAGFELLDTQPALRAAEGHPLAENALLLSACSLAIDHGLSRVVWPRHLGGEAGDRAIDAYDRANVISHLAAIDLPRHGGPGEIRVEVPLLELSDVEILDLALDLDAPVPRPVQGAAAFSAGVGACWWCEGGGVEQCGVCGPCGRWGVAWGRIDPAGVLSAGQ